MINNTLLLGRAEDNEAVRYWTEQGGGDGPPQPPSHYRLGIKLIKFRVALKEDRSSRALTKTLLKIHLTFQFYIFLPSPIRIPYVCRPFCSSRCELFQRFAKTSRGLALEEFAFDFRTRLDFYFESARYWNLSRTDSWTHQIGRTMPRIHLVLRCFLRVTIFKGFKAPPHFFKTTSFCIGIIIEYHNSRSTWTY